MKVAAIDALSLKQAIRKVAFARARKGERKDEWPSTEGVHFEFAPVGKSYVVATDNIQLAVSEVRPEVFEKCEFTALLRPDWKSVRGRCTVYVGDGRMKIEHDGGEVVCPLIEGEYPDWRSVIPPAKDDRYIDFEAADLRAALDEIGTEKVTLSRWVGDLVLRGLDREICATVSAQGPGSCESILDGRRLRAYLRIVGKSSIRAWIPSVDRDRRVMARFDTEAGSHLYVLVPIRPFLVVHWIRSGKTCSIPIKWETAREILLRRRETLS